MKKGVTALLLVLCCQAHASYRLYQLKVTYLDSPKATPRVQTVLSNLDPFQWENYYGEAGLVKVEMLDTWYCPGDTSHHKYCDKPKVDERTPASTYPSRNRLPYGRQPVIP